MLIDPVIPCRETGDKPADSDQGAATVTLKLWRRHLLVVEILARRAQSTV